MNSSMAIRPTELTRTILFSFFYDYLFLYFLIIAVLIFFREVYDLTLFRNTYNYCYINIICILSDVPILFIDFININSRII